MKVITIGRDTDNDIVTNDSKVSRHHVQIVSEGASFKIVDLNSSNGTFVNGLKISGAITITESDTVKIGNTVLPWQSYFRTGKKNGGEKWIWIAGASAAAVIIGVLFFVKPWSEKPWSAEKVYNYYKKSIVMIEAAYYYQINIKGKAIGYFALDKDGNPAITEEFDNAKFFVYTGTGFIVSDEGKIVTNRHITTPWEYDKENASDIRGFVKKELTEMSLGSAAAYRELAPLIGEVTVEGKLIDGYYGIYLNDTHKTESSKVPCHVLKDSGSDDIDIGVIQINSKTLPPGVKNIVSLDNAVVEDAGIVVGNLVYTIGFPAGEHLAQTSQGIEANNQDGKITQIRGDYEFGHNISIIGGASGSPVFNEYGQLIGVVHRGLSKSQGYNMAIKAKYAVDLAK